MRSHWILAAALVLLTAHAVLPAAQIDLEDLRPRTSQERALAEYFDRFSSSSADLVARATTIAKRGFTVSTVHSSPRFVDNSPLVGERERSADAIRDIVVCNAGMLMAGLVTDIRSVLTRNEKSVYTAYTVAVERSFRGAPHANRTIVVGQNGGTVKVDGQSVYMGIGVPDWLFLNNRYMFYLTPTSDSDAFVLDGPPDKLMPRVESSSPDTVLDKFQISANKCQRP